MFKLGFIQKSFQAFLWAMTLIVSKKFAFKAPIKLQSLTLESEKESTHCNIVFSGRND